MQKRLPIITPPVSCVHIYSDETHLHWFHASSIDLDTEFELIGILIGLAIYNSHILEFQFPVVLYKQLMGQSVGLEDLGELHPYVYKHLREIMAYNKHEIESLELNFQVCRGIANCWKVLQSCFPYIWYVLYQVVHLYLLLEPCWLPISTPLLTRVLFYIIKHRIVCLMMS